MPRGRLGRWGKVACGALLFGLAYAELVATRRIARELYGTPPELGSLTAPSSALALSGSLKLADARAPSEAPDTGLPSEAPDTPTLTTPSPWRSGEPLPRATAEPNPRAPAVPEAPRTASLAGLLRGVRVVPEQRDGKLVGLRLRGVSPDGLLGHIGLKEGDRLDTINGYRVTEPNEVLVLHARLRQLDHLSIAIERDGRPVTIEINIV